MDTNSILLTIKHMLGGLVEDEGHFNLDLVVLINSAFTKLWQLGVGPTDAPFKIEDDTAEWSDFEYDDIEMVKEWIYLDVKTIFKTVAVVFNHKDIGQGAEKPVAFNIERQKEWDKVGINGSVR